MALEDILRALDEQADEECADIMQVAESQAAAIIEEARREAEEITRDRMAAAEESGRHRFERAVSAVRLDGMRELSTVRQDAFEAVFEAARERLAGLRGSGEYERVFEGLLREALDGVDSSCALLVDPADQQLASAALKRVGASCEVEPSLATAGGLVVSVEGGKVLRRNTFESRLELTRGSAQSSIAEIME